jgi:methylase of polypeptide subunit release factors
MLPLPDSGRARRLRALLHQLRPHTVAVAGHRIAVPPGVLDPVAFRTGAAWAPRVARALAPPTRLLDMGCGTGVVGVLAQAAGARVTAVDLDPRACAAARTNGLRDVRQGDLFRAVLGERFDRICFNPPFFRGHAGGRPLGRALYGGPALEVVRRFAAGAPRHLAPGGEAWALLSDRAPGAERALGPGWRRVETWPLPPDGLPPERLSVWVRSAG